MPGVRVCRYWLQLDIDNLTHYIDNLNNIGGTCNFIIGLTIAYTALATSNQLQFDFIMPHLIVLIQPADISIKLN